MFHGNVIDPTERPDDLICSHASHRSHSPHSSNMQNGFCMGRLEQWIICEGFFFCHGKYIVSCSRGWKKNSLSSFFNEVPNVNPILLSRADSEAPVLKSDCPSVHLQVMWKQAALEREAVSKTNKKLFNKSGAEVSCNQVARVIKVRLLETFDPGLKPRGSSRSSTRRPSRRRERL